jgi:ribosomal protein S27AE
MAVCSFCRSTLVRDGETLRRIGESAQLFDDHSPLALGGRGRLQGEPFTLIGRVQLAYRDDDGQEGRWTEWHALFDNGRSGSLSEDNGAYVFSFALPAETNATLPDLSKTALGATVLMANKPWVLSSRVQARVHAAQGELAQVPDLQRTYPVVELRNANGEVLSVEPDAKPPRLDLGRTVLLPDLALSGIADAKDVAESKVKAKGFECPHCGAALMPTLDNTQSIVCGSCHSVIDISQGLGADLKYYRQDNTLEPLIPLGKLGKLKVGPRVNEWQVVGYQERCDVPTDPEDEQTFWREYLLYNRMMGFAFLVDAQDGWSVVRPVTGVPASKGDTLSFEGASYRKRYTYPAKTTYVLGEFYWPVRKEQRSLNTDYAGQGAGAHLRLNREQTGNEITWSAGEALRDEDVMKAFGIPADKMGVFKRDVKAGFGDTGQWLAAAFWIALVIVILLVLARCDNDDCGDVRSTYGEYSNEYRQCRDYARSSGSHGGSYGGYSSGGFHK